jgi:hypothetical protein
MILDLPMSAEYRSSLRKCGSYFGKYPEYPEYRSSLRKCGSYFGKYPEYPEYQPMAICNVESTRSLDHGS